MIKILKNKFIVNTAAFKKESSSKLDQAAQIHQAKELGFAAIEIRNELLDGSLEELERISQQAQAEQLEVYFSVGDVLFKDQHLNPAFEQYLEQMRNLGAQYLKMNLGNFSHSNASAGAQLNDYLDGSFHLYLENNQTPNESDLQKTIAFFQQNTCSDISYCFDIANWEWLQADVYEAAKQLAPVTDYLHLKNFVYDNSKKKVTSLEKGILDWRRIIKIFTQVNQFGFEYYAEPTILQSDLELVQQSLS